MGGSISGGHAIYDEGILLPQRSKLNFIGSGLVAYDDIGNDATIVSGTASGGGSSTGTAVYMLAGIPISLDGTPQSTYWRVPSSTMVTNHVLYLSMVYLSYWEQIIKYNILHLEHINCYRLLQLAQFILLFGEFRCQYKVHLL